MATLLPQRLLATQPTKPYHGAWISVAGSPTILWLLAKKGVRNMRCLTCKPYTLDMQVCSWNRWSKGTPRLAQSRNAMFPHDIK